MMNQEISRTLLHGQLFLPKTLFPDVLLENHEHMKSGHDKLYIIKEKLLQCYYCPNMDKT